MDIFKNPETIEEGAQNVKDFIFNKLNIALSNDDPIIAEYLILSEFYKKQTDLLSSTISLV